MSRIRLFWRNLDKRKRVTLLTIIASMTFLLTTISYAFFSTVADNSRSLKAELSTANLALTFADGDNGVNAKLNFGESTTKKFKIANTGTGIASLSLDWKELINTYLDGSLSYKLIQYDDAGNKTTIIENTNMPTSRERLTQTLAGEISVAPQKTYTYDLVITLNNLPDKEQSADLKAVFNTKFAVNQPKKYRYYTLTVNPNGGTWNTYTTNTNYQLKSGETMDILTPSRVGYDFTGWEVSAPTSKLIDGVYTMGISDTILTATWKPKKYTLTIKIDENDSSKDTTRTIDYLGTTEVENPSKTGHTFTGWTISPEDKGYFSGTSFTIKDSNVTITANYVPNTYRWIAYHMRQAIDGTYTLESATTDKTGGEAIFGTEVYPEFSPKDGFTNPSSKNKITIGVDVQGVDEIPVNNKTEYQYPRNKYTLTIYNNGEEETREVLYQDTVNVNEIEGTKEGYSITGFYMMEGNGTIRDNTFEMGLDGATIYASYTANTYTITFNANGGKWSDDTVLQSVNTVYNSAYALPASDPSRTFYTFKGWYTAPNGGEQVTSSTKLTKAENHILYAQWEKIFNVKDAVLAMKNHQTPEGVITTPPTATEFYEGTKSNTEGIYAMADDYGTSYYYRGAVTKNYVKFGTNSEGKDMYWRIIRINGDGSIRMIFDGTQGYKNRNGASTYQESNTDRFIATEKKFNTYTSDAKYVGYIYGGENGVASTSKQEAEGKDTDSDIKVVVESWYEANLKEEDKYLADGTFCIDRSVSATPGEWDSSEPSLDGSQDLRGYGKNKTAYGIYGRFYGNKATKIPQFTCPREEDILTVANKGLKKKIGLITADEVIAAGAGNGKFYYHYLNKSSSYSYWSLSPNRFTGSSSVFCISEKGNRSSCYVSSTGAVAPVINLSAEYATKLVGDGTFSSPYKISDQEAVEYDEIFNPNGGNWNGSTLNKTQQQKYGSDYILPRDPTREGYVFLGWYTSPEGGSQITTTTTVSKTTAQTLYAQWGKIFNEIFNPNGGNWNGSTSNKIQQQAYGIEYVFPEHPTKIGYGFKGWFTAPSGGTQVTTSTIVTTTSAQTLYAQWEQSFVNKALIAMQNHQTPNGVITTPPTVDEFKLGMKSNTGEEGVYAMADDYTNETGNPSYYYRGAVTKNYVKFGKNASNQDMFWRIIRINGDGSLRMIYDGTRAHENYNGTSPTGAADRAIVADQAFNANYDDAKYVGYKYGGAKGEASTSKQEAEAKDTDSDIKKVVEEWYTANLSEEDKYLADGTFCNDRSISETAGEWWNYETMSLSGGQDLRGAGRNFTAYGAYGRFNGSKPTYTPQFTCPRGDDILTVANKGLGKKIGLITADEVIAAGGCRNTNCYYHYLNKYLSAYWTLSPYNNDNYYASVLTVNSYGAMTSYSVSAAYNEVAPVINLSAEYAKQLEGGGTIGDEYKLPSGV